MFIVTKVVKMKKRILLGFPAFCVAFLFGYIVVPQMTTVSQETVVRKPANNAASITTEYAPSDELEILDEVNDFANNDIRSYQLKLIEIGEFHGDEVPARNGEEWLGLFQEGTKYSLRPTNVKIARVHDDIVDGGTKSLMSGKSVDVQGGNKPILLVQNALILRPGRVVGAFRGADEGLIDRLEMSGIEMGDPYTRLEKGFRCQFDIGGKTFTLKVIEAQNKNGEKILALALYADSSRQILHTTNVNFNPDLGELYWVGDLDHDGKPDIFCNLFEHYNVNNSVLFLSSSAKKGLLVKKVAEFWRTGC